MYSVFVHDILRFKLLVFYIFFYHLSFRRIPIIYSHVNVSVYNDKVFVDFYIYDGHDVQRYYDFTRGYRKLMWRHLYSVSW